MEVAPPGYYPAAGDPAGTVRYWDGVEWSAAPMAPPPGYDPSRRPGDERFAAVWVRIGAIMIDALIAVLLSVVLLVQYLIDVFEDIDAGGDASTVAVPGHLYLLGVGLGVTWMLCTAYLGGTPGKLVTGLRVTRADGRTTPPGLAAAALRSLPGLFGIIPALGPLIGFGFAIASLVMVNTDPERRSAYDRIAGTRVVYKRHL
jgi:uncharacterized RDD family membrane protein YckC